MNPIKKIAFCVNREKPKANELCTELTKDAERLNVEWKVCERHPLTLECLKGQDVCFVIGGDGTLLSAVDACVKNQVPVVGINQGKLGFLTTISIEDAKKSFESVLKGAFVLSKRFILRCTAANGDCALALNDIVVKHYAPSRLMELNVFCNDQFVNSFSSDGLIIATPTGSTAYNLSAGGPIIVPGAGVFTLTPICPHTLTNRSVVFDNQSILSIDVPEIGSELEKQAHVSLDGQVPWIATDIFPLKVTIAKEMLLLLQPKDYSHFSILRQKLSWGGTN